MADSFIRTLDQWDRQAFSVVNGSATHPVLDAVAPFLRAPMFWMPLYLFAFLFVWSNWGARGGWWVLFFLCTAAITDLTGARIFKEGFDRLRPCQDPQMMTGLRLLLERCSGSSSFVSNHAANHFALAVFAVRTLQGSLGRWMHLSFLWAAAVAWAQVYVGVHYPLDVLGGAGLGVVAGLLTAYLYEGRFGSLKLELN